MLQIVHVHDNGLRQKIYESDFTGLSSDTVAGTFALRAAPKVAPDNMPGVVSLVFTPPVANTLRRTGKTGAVYA